MIPTSCRHRSSPLFPYTTLFRSTERFHDAVDVVTEAVSRTSGLDREVVSLCLEAAMDTPVPQHLFEVTDRKSTRLNSSHVAISYAVFCLKKKTTSNNKHR